MKAHIGVDAESGLVHTVRGTSGNVNVNDVVEANALLHGDATEVFADAGYAGRYTYAYNGVRLARRSNSIFLAASSLLRPMWLRPVAEMRPCAC